MKWLLLTVVPVCAVLYGIACGFFLKLSLLIIITLATIVVVLLVPKMIPISKDARINFTEGSWATFYIFNISMWIVKFVRWIS